MAECNIFEEDEVAIFSSTGFKCGLVIENSEYLSSDDEEDQETAGYQPIRNGTVRVVWHPDGTEEVLPEEKVFACTFEIICNIYQLFLF